MTHPTPSIWRIAWLSVIALVAAAPAFAQADANRAFLERASLRAADEVCELFDMREQLALEMGFWQSRGALLRGGYSADRINALHEEAIIFAESKSCDDPGMQVSSARLKDAFLAFSRTPFMEFRGIERQWIASRTLTDVWSTYQEDPASRVRLGLVYNERASDPLAFAEPDKARPPPLFSTVFPLPEGASPPAYARLILRDSAKSPEAWLGLFGHNGGLTPPPRGVSRQLWASGRKIIDAPPYEDGDKTRGALFLFDEKARAAFESLDPREAITLEFAPSGRSPDAKAVRVVMEVGDFRAAAAFGAIPRDQPQPAEGEAEDETADASTPAN